MKPLIVFAPGAGAPSSHPWMQNWKRRLSEIGDVETLDYAYMREGRKRPDPLPKLIAAHREALRDVRKRHPSKATILIGKSVGGRVGCHLSLDEKVNGLPAKDKRLKVTEAPLTAAQNASSSKAAKLREHVEELKKQYAVTPA